MTRPSFIECKAELATADDGAITGKAWDYTVPDRVNDWIAKGAFTGATLPVPMLFAHDPAQPVGVWDALEEADDGLTVKGRLLIEQVGRAREVKALIDEGAVTGLSVGFITRKAAARRGGGRTIASAELVECSLVVTPCHPRARIAKAGHDAIAIADILNRAAVALRA